MIDQILKVVFQKARISNLAVSKGLVCLSSSHLKSSFLEWYEEWNDKTWKIKLIDFDKQLYCKIVAMKFN